MKINENKKSMKISENLQKGKFKKRRKFLLKEWTKSEVESHKNPAWDFFTVAKEQKWEWERKK